MPDILTGVIFDHSTLFPTNNDPALYGEIRTLLENLRGAGIKVGVFSTHRINLSASLSRHGFPPIDLLLTTQDVDGARKGAKVWMQTASQRLGVPIHQLLYVGDDKKEWLTAINVSAMYIHAAWICELPRDITAFIAPSPLRIWNFITHYLLIPPRWEYTLDILDRGVHIRSLLGASVSLPATNPNRFTLQDIFTYNNPVTVSNFPAQLALMNHAISSLYLEGLIEYGSLFAVYPSSTPGHISPVLQRFLEPAAKVFHGYFKEDILVRAAQGIDTSLERARGRRHNVKFTNQTNTVHLNRAYASKIAGHNVIVFDDFTTSGMSLEWARNLLANAGAKTIILLTIGKYKTTHTIYTPTSAGLIRPFELNDYDVSDFETHEAMMSRNPAAQTIIRTSFQHLKDGLPYPVA